MTRELRAHRETRDRPEKEDHLVRQATKVLTGHRETQGPKVKWVKEASRVQVEDEVTLVFLDHRDHQELKDQQVHLVPLVLQGPRENRVV